MTAITLRASNQADAAFVDRLTFLAMQRYVEATWPDEAARGAYYELNKFEQPYTRIIVYHGRDAGRLSVKREPARLYIDNIHILPEFQGEGIASQLIGDVLAEGQANSLPVELMVLQVNPARHLYERLGFKVVTEENHRFHMRHDG